MNFFLPSIITSFNTFVSIDRITNFENRDICLGIFLSEGSIVHNTFLTSDFFNERCTCDNSQLLYLITFNFEKGKSNTKLSVDKLYQGNRILPPFIFLMLVTSTEREAKYRRTSLHMVGKRASRETFLQFFEFWVRLNKREKEESEPIFFPLPFWEFDFKVIELVLFSSYYLDMCDKSKHCLVLWKTMDNILPEHGNSGKELG